jgi:hypothetical protein
VGLERSPLSLVTTIEKLLGRKISGCGPENQECGRGDQFDLRPRGLLLLILLLLLISLKLLHLARPGVVVSLRGCGRPLCDSSHCLHFLVACQMQ